MRTERYDGTCHQELWDRIASTATQSSLLHMRGFMDYHGDRFNDCSLLFFDGHERVVGVLPAHLERGNHPEIRVCSHDGLTFGGLLTTPGTSSAQIGEMLFAAANLYQEEFGAKWLRYKPVPHIYHNQPSEADLYFLWRAGAKLTGRAISSTIRLDNPLPFSTLRRRKLKKAKELGVVVRLGNSEEDLTAFHQILTQVLHDRHDVIPVHTLDELQLLFGRFADRIALYVAECDGVLLGGTILFLSKQVVHAQYIAASDAGLEACALEFLFHHLIHEMNWEESYFDFGTSTEHGGHFLNEGLLFQKEGLGARATTYDTYEVPLAGLLNLQ